MSTAIGFALAGAARVPVQLSFPTLVAGPASALLGAVYLGATLKIDGGRFSQIGRVLRGGFDNLLTVLMVDFCAGLLVALLFGMVGATHPVFLVSLIQRRPVIGWAVVGCLGIPLAKTVLDHLPTLDPAAEPASSRVEKAFARLRSMPIDRLFDALYVEMEAELVDEEDQLLSSVERLASEGLLTFDRLAGQAEKYAERRNRAMPTTVSVAMKRLKDWPIGADPGEETVVLAEAMVSSGFSDPVRVCCQAAEARRQRATVDAAAMSTPRTDP